MSSADASIACQSDLRSHVDCSPRRKWKPGCKALQPLNLPGKIALITGGTRGIGAATAIALAREGADVAIIGRHLDGDAKATRESIITLGRRCEIIVADCGQPADTTRCVREAETRLGPVDVVVHSAGGPVNGGLFELTPEAWHAAFDVHVHAIFHLCRAAIPAMRARKA